jgi:hypothetical protein
MRTSLAVCTLALFGASFSACSPPIEDPLAPSPAASGSFSIAPPGPVFPGANEQVGWLEQPLVLSVSNAVVTGSSTAAVTYEFDMATDSGFTNLVFSVKGVGQGSGKTTVEVPRLPTPASLFWRARATSGTVTSAHSATTPFEIEAQGGHVSPAGYADPGGNWISEEYALAIINGCADEFPQTLRVFGSTEEAELAAEELLLRIIWHLKLSGFNAARQQNPSGAISRDKMNIFIRESWRTYDIFALGVAGVPTRLTGLGRVFPENPVGHDGIAD